MATDRHINELAAFGCKDPRWFLEDHIPRHAIHTGKSFPAAYQDILSQLVALDEVRQENFQAIINTGLARKVLSILGQQGLTQHVGERPLIVRDNYCYRMTRVRPPTEHDAGYEYQDPLVPLTIANFRLMTDDIRILPVNVMIGRPKASGELWLEDGMTVDDYDLVRNCFKKLVALRQEGKAPYLDSCLDHIYVPYTLGHPEWPFDPSEIHHDPVDYSSLPT